MYSELVIIHWITNFVMVTRARRIVLGYGSRVTGSPEIIRCGAAADRDPPVRMPVVTARGTELEQVTLAGQQRAYSRLPGNGHRTGAAARPYGAY